MTRIPGGDPEAAPGHLRCSHQIDSRDLHGEPTPRLDQTGCLIVRDGVRATRSGGLDVELLEDLDRQPDIACGEDLIRAGGLAALCGVP